MGLLSRIKTWITGEILTASDLNGEFNNILNNLTPAIVEDISANVTAMQVTVDPGEVGSESLASNLTGELQRLRNIVKEITGEAQWYVSPDRSLNSGSFYNSFTSNSGDPDVANIDLLIVDTSGAPVTLTGLQNGVTDQILFVAKIDGTNALTIANNGAGTQKIFNGSGGDITIAAADRGGVILIFNGTDWTNIDAIEDNSITGNKLAPGIVDDSTIELAADVLQVKDLGITGAKLAAGIIDFQIQTFSSNGTFNVPSDVSEVILFGSGGAGGGGAGSPNGAGAGGQGNIPMMIQATVTPSAAITVTIGAGGGGGIFSSGSAGGNGAVGSDTTFLSLTFFGARGGSGAAVSAGGGGKGDAFFARKLESGGGTGATEGGNGADGSASVFAAGGTQGGANAAGGGGSSFGQGGTGGNPGNPGSAGGGGGTAAGGGGGGLNNGGGADGGNGGNGGAGNLIVIYTSSV